MRELFNIIRKYYYILLFLLIESLCVVLLIQGNDFHYSKAVNFFRSVTAGYYSRVEHLREYLSLRETNRQLAAENTRLRNMIKSSFFEKGNGMTEVTDTAHRRHYRYTLARVVNNSINKQYNYLTLDRGSEDGVKPDMAVITDRGIVGIVTSVSAHFSQVISVLNRDMKISARLVGNKEPGTLEWRGYSCRRAVLTDIPHDATITEGDTVTTSGLSPIFPDGLLIGFVEKYHVENGSFYAVDVILSNDFRKLQWVYVVDNLLREEQIKLERGNGE